ncbi:energy transducer TonB [Oligoflexus tunisiensis]|uniref:energy transducer TonB n=1 Tax=Oligoflexus tunisiensis TaxID=708132 RepID=UPI00159F0967|nr:energy transducer TonB [Oligoflexus tunisiensis]
MKKLGILLLLGACTTTTTQPPARNHSSLTVVGKPAGVLKSTALVELTDDDWKSIEERASCVTHLYECQFDKTGQITGLKALDHSDPAFQSLTEESLRTWRFQEGQEGTCHAQIIYERNEPTHVLLVEPDMAVTMVSNLQKNRAALPPKNERPLPGRIRQEKPQMPREMALKGVQGFITVNYDIDEAGVPTNFKIIDEDPEGALEKSALRALRRWRYAPLAKEPNSARNTTTTLTYRLVGSRNFMTSCDLGLRLNRLARPPIKQP